MKCPRCQADAEGNFCPACGASLRPTACTSCGAQPDAGDRFCNKCGTYLHGPEGGAAVPPGAAATTPGLGGANAGWLAAGGLLVVLMLVMLWPRLQNAGRPPAASVAPSGSPVGVGGAGAVDLNSMTPREAADRLFGRVMEGVSAGDDAEVQNFLPMAIAAYDRAMPLDADGLFHKALLQMTGSDPDGALTTARVGLSEAPDHLLLLSVAGEAQTALGNDGEAATLYSHLLDVWEAQTASGLADYDAHQQMLPEIQARARGATGS